MWTNITALNQQVNYTKSKKLKKEKKMKLKSAPSTCRRWKKIYDVIIVQRWSNFRNMWIFLALVVVLRKTFSSTSHGFPLINSLSWAQLYIKSLRKRKTKNVFDIFFSFSFTFFHFRLKPPNCAVYKLKTHKPS